jgi:hypothetical protein
MRRGTLIVVTKAASRCPRACARGPAGYDRGREDGRFGVLSEGELARVLNHPPPGQQIIEELIESMLNFLGLEQAEGAFAALFFDGNEELLTAMMQTKGKQLRA